MFEEIKEVELIEDEEEVLKVEKDDRTYVYVDGVLQGYWHDRYNWIDQQYHHEFIEA